MKLYNNETVFHSQDKIVYDANLDECLNKDSKSEGTINISNIVTDKLIIYSKYREIMQRYRNGEYGKDHLSLYEILEKAGEQNLLKQLTLREVLELIKHPSRTPAGTLILVEDKIEQEIEFVKKMKSNINQKKSK